MARDELERQNFITTIVMVYLCLLQEDSYENMMLGGSAYDEELEEGQERFRSLPAAPRMMKNARKGRPRSVSPPPALDVEVAKVNCWSPFASSHDIRPPS